MDRRVLAPSTFEGVCDRPFLNRSSTEVAKSMAYALNLERTGNRWFRFCC